MLKYLLNIILLLTLSSTVLTASNLSDGNLEKISLQLQWKYQFQFAGFLVAKEKGFYKDAGFDLDIKEWKSGINMVDEVMRDNSTYAVARSTALIDIANEKEIILLAAIYQSSPLVLVTTEESKINSVKDFKHKRVMSSGDLNRHASVLSMMFSQGVDVKDIIIQKPSFNVQDLIDGKTDLMASYISNEPFLLQELGSKAIIFNPKDYGFDFYSDILITSKTYLEKYPHKVEKFRDASLKGWEYAFTHIEETVEILLKKYNTQNKSKDALLFEAKELKKLIYDESGKIGKIEKHKLEKIYDTYKLVGLVNKNIDFDEFIYNPSKFSKILTKKEKEYLKTKKVITMCNNPNWAPIVFAKDGDTMQGIAIDTLHILEDSLDIKFKNISTQDWKESQQFFKEKKCDILPAVIKTPQRQKYANFTKPYLNLPLAIFTTKDKNIISGLDEIMDKSWSRQEGSALIAVIKKKYPNMNFIGAKSDEETFKNIENGKAYFTIATLPVASYTISKFMINNIHIAGYTQMVHKLSIGVRDDDKVLLSILDKSLQNIPKEKTQKIFKKWVSTPVKESVIDYSLVFKLLGLFFILGLALLYRQIVLKDANNKLQQKVSEKTKELLQLNETLEQKIKEEVKKNLQKEQILFQQSKMAAMGEMIGNIAHQWRQPIAIISMWSNNIMADLDIGETNDKSLRKYATKINEQTHHLSQTIDDFRNFFIPNKEKNRFTLKGSIDKTMNLLSASFKTHNIEVIEDIKNIEIETFENELTQSILNIIKNAKDVLISFDNNRRRLIFITIYKKEDHAIIEIKDNAGGIPKEIIDKIFEPYFTTKHKSQGTGIGLYMTESIITKHLHGKIDIQNIEYTYENKNYKGALFRISLPIEEDIS